MLVVKRFTDDITENGALGVDAILRYSDISRYAHAVAIELGEEVDYLVN